MQGQLSERLSRQSRAFVWGPNQPDAYDLRSEIRRRLGDDKGAIVDRQKAEALYKAIEEEEDRN
ncbi:hypothetical protein [Argonema galeatum]|uniref:hypothetical protein n=1 Tax=Argonema galeatum TaxID=2942762 RepID=UPI0020131440|nr:hypothetical protein [Argonema galeatum]MCL1463966.1 hypothetical protein [Argonema galeatum A003/A1]